MLRITEIRDDETHPTVQLCGRFTAEYVAEVENTIARQAKPGVRVSLDLSHVTFVDRPAMVFLCAAGSRNVAIENLPSYVRRWMEQERICGPTSGNSDETLTEG